MLEELILSNVGLAVKLRVHSIIETIFRIHLILIKRLKGEYLINKSGKSLFKNHEDGQFWRLAL